MPTDSEDWTVADDVDGKARELDISVGPLAVVAVCPKTNGNGVEEELETVAPVEVGGVLAELADWPKLNLNGDEAELLVASVEVVVAAGCPKLNWRGELLDGWEMVVEADMAGVDENSDDPCWLLLCGLNRFEVLLFSLAGLAARSISDGLAVAPN